MHAHHHSHLPARRHHTSVTIHARYHRPVTIHARHDSSSTHARYAPVLSTPSRFTSFTMRRYHTPVTMHARHHTSSRYVSPPRPILPYHAPVTMHARYHTSSTMHARYLYIFLCTPVTIHPSPYTSSPCAVTIHIFHHARRHRTHPSPRPVTIRPLPFIFPQCTLVTMHALQNAPLPFTSSTTHARLPPVTMRPVTARVCRHARPLPFIFHHARPSFTISYTSVTIHARHHSHIPTMQPVTIHARHHAPITIHISQCRLIDSSHHAPVTMHPSPFTSPYARLHARHHTPLPLYLPPFRHHARPSPFTLSHTVTMHISHHARPRHTPVTIHLPAHARHHAPVIHASPLHARHHARPSPFISQPYRPPPCAVTIHISHQHARHHA
ncbi:extensin-3-like, partial [Homarus americanus]|uniref:extensin-3-like n=1 Tax=Homarus americanus TaxID=6706 RepID=UPI001C46B106